jgi:hypothetical protein
VSYFSALARHTGVHIGGRRAGDDRRIRPNTLAIDIAVTRAVPETAATTDPPRARAEARPATPPREALAPRPVEAVSRPNATDANANRDTVVPHAPPAAIREITDETGGHASVVVVTGADAAQPVADVPARSAAPAQQPAPGRAIARESPEPAAAEEPRPLPTIENVRQWVAPRPADRAREPDHSADAVPGRPPARPIVPAVAVATADVEHFTLDIGSIEITSVAPSAVAAAAPSPARVAPPVTPPSVGRASRHYIRT